MPSVRVVGLTAQSLVLFRRKLSYVNMTNSPVAAIFLGPDFDIECMATKYRVYRKDYLM